MADESPEKPEAGGSKNKLILIMVMVNLLAVAGLGVYMVAFQGGGDSSAEEEAVEEQGPTFGPIIAMAPLVTNLAGEDNNRYIKIVVQLEVEDELQQIEVEAALVPIRDAILGHISRLNVDDLEGPDKRLELATAIMTQANQLFGEDAEKIRRVFFTEFVIQ